MNLLNIQSPHTTISHYLRDFSTAFWARKGSAQRYLDHFLSELDPILSQRRIAATVVAIIRETSEACTIVLRPSSRWKEFIAGQYLAIDIEIDGIRYRRNYSISCCPAYFKETGNISITVKTVANGKVSDYLNSKLAVSDVVHISESNGQFVLPSRDQILKSHNPVFFAGGSGITPIRSMIGHLLEKRSATNLDESPDITLIHYAKNVDDIIYQNHFERLAQLNERFTYIKHYSDLEGDISIEQLKQDGVSLEDKSIYLCGPEGFMLAVRELAGALSVSDADIYSESFGGSRTALADDVHAEEGIVDFTFADVQVRSNGKKTLLELAESAGLEPKFGCRSGICHECKCHRPEGALVNSKTGKAISQDLTHVQSCITVPSGNIKLKQW